MHRNMTYEDTIYDHISKIPFKACITTITSYVYVDNIINVDMLKTHIQNRKVFHNSVHIKHHLGFGIKIFRTGIHITGCKRFEQIDDVVAYVGNMLLEVCQTGLQVARKEIQLVNIMFDMSHHVCLEGLWHVVTNVGMVARYDRETYAGIKIKINGATVLGFSSGKFMICGLKQHHNLLEIFETFYGIYEKNKHKILM